MNATPIKRFDTLSDYAIMWDFEDGDYVRYEDHVETVESLHTEVQMLRDLVAGLRLTLAAKGDGNDT